MPMFNARVFVMTCHPSNGGCVTHRIFAKLGHLLSSFSWRRLMKREVMLAVVVGIGGLAIVFAAQRAGAAQANTPKVVEVDKIKDNLYVLKGGGGNTAVFVTTNGVVVVD